MFKQFPLVYLHSMYRWREIGYTFVQAKSLYSKWDFPNIGVSRGPSF